MDYMGETPMGDANMVVEVEAGYVAVMRDADDKSYVLVRPDAVSYVINDASEVATSTTPKPLGRYSLADLRGLLEQMEYTRACRRPRQDAADDEHDWRAGHEPEAPLGES